MLNVIPTPPFFPPDLSTNSHTHTLFFAQERTHTHFKLSKVLAQSPLSSILLDCMPMTETETLCARACLWCPKVHNCKKKHFGQKMKNLKNFAPFFARVIHNISGWMVCGPHGLLEFYTRARMKSARPSPSVSRVGRYSKLNFQFPTHSIVIEYIKS